MQCRYFGWKKRQKIIFNPVVGKNNGQEVINHRGFSIMGLSIDAIGYYLPENRISNDFLLAMLRRKGGQFVDVERLRKKLILNKAETRHFKNPDETGADMAEKAAGKCLEKVNFNPKDLELILYVGMLRDYVEPAMSIILQDRLG